MRVPFLDVALVQFLESLPVSLKLRGRTGKYIHKKAAAKWLPKEIIHRKKRNFATPMDEWLQSDLTISLKKLLNVKDSACRQYFNLDFVNSMIEQHRAGKANFSTQLFMLLSFEFWHRHFLQREKIEESALSEVGEC
jgi:asparagine synthase (glutamine-hydrolysing)